MMSNKEGADSHTQDQTVNSEHDVFAIGHRAQPNQWSFFLLQTGGTVFSYTRLISKHDKRPPSIILNVCRGDGTLSVVRRCTFRDLHDK